MKRLTRINRLTENELLVDESIFSVANGYIGVRGSFTEGYGTSYEYNQAYLNGLYEFYDYTYEENLTGFPQTGQRFVNLMDGQKIRLTFQKNRINLDTCNIVNLERYYELEKGYTKRIIHYQTKDKQFDFYVEEIKFVSRHIKELIGIELKVYSPNYKGEIKVKSFLQESLRQFKDSNDPRVQLSRNSMNIDGINVEDSSIKSSTTRSKFHVKSTMLHNLDLYTKKDGNVLKSSGYFKIDKPLTIQKYVIHVSDLYSDDIEKRTTEIKKELDQITFEELLGKQEEYYTDFCNSSFVNSESEELSSLLNYNIYQLNNSGGECDVHNISAKGLSGEGYEGHYFWDTEIYMIPFFILTNPEKAKNLLMYRYRILENAKQEAKNLGYTKGAKIPWRTINGDETSPYYPAGSAQFHINSDVAYAIIKYIEATNDIEFLKEYGFELLVETARFLEEATNYSEGFYHLNSVTGPDEYTTVVDDNFYTNKMLQYHFKKTAKFYNEYRTELREVIKKISVTKEEIMKLSDIAEYIYLPFDEELNIYAQDKNFLSKKKLDLSTIPKENFPLLLNYHPLFLYKHQVLKQADTMLALILLDDVDKDVLKSSFEYYEPITTHDSSLSKCVYSIVANQIGQQEMACDYFKQVLETDYNNTHHNTEHGLHLANLGGSYLGFLYGIVGVRVHQSYLKIAPKLTKAINDYELQLQYQNETITVSVKEEVTIKVSGPVNIKIYDKEILLTNQYVTKIQD